MNQKEKQEVSRDLAAIQGLARKLRQGSGIPVVESCARWCENYSQIAQWSLGEAERFEFMETTAVEQPATRPHPTEGISAPPASERLAAKPSAQTPAAWPEPQQPAVVPAAAAAKPIPASRDGRKAPRWGMAIDLKRCVGCQSCTLACKVENGTPPGVFWMRVLEKEEGTYPSARTVFLPLRCNHCSDPPCVPVCPTGASYKREKDNLVLIDQNKCIGCSACVVACPYQVRFITHNSKGYYGEQMTPFETLSYQKWQPRTAMKCTFCVHRIDQGLEPACVQTCPTRSLVFGDLNDPQSEISNLIRGRSHFQPRAELGTDPSLYYMT